MTTFLSPRDIARSIGVSESSVKRWVDDGLIEATRTAGGHRRVPLPEVIRFVRESRTPVVHPELLGLADVADASGSSGTLEEYLIAGSAPEARGTITSLYLGGTTLETIFDHHVRDAMHHIGELWTERDDGIFIEHRALTICVQAVTQLRLMLPTPQGPRAVGGAIAGDIYVLPSMMVATTLDGLGFQSCNLGADTPFSAVERSLEEEPASLVWISVSRVEEPDRRARELRSFLKSKALGGASVIIGGRETQQLKLRPRDSLVEFSTLAELAAFARGRLNAG